MPQRAGHRVQNAGCGQNHGGEVDDQRGDDVDPDLLHDLLHEAEEVRKPSDFSDHHDIQNMVTHVLYHLQEHMAYLPGLVSGESGEVFMYYFRQHLRELFSSTVPASAYKAPYDYVLNHMVCDFAETVRWWTLNKQYSPEEISAFFFETTTNAAEDGTPGASRQKRPEN